MCIGKERQPVTRKSIIQQNKAALWDWGFVDRKYLHMDNDAHRKHGKIQILFIKCTETIPLNVIVNN